MNHQAANTNQLNAVSLDETTATDPALRSSGVQAKAGRLLSVPPAGAAASEPPLVSIRSIADADLLEPAYAYLCSYCRNVLAPRLAERFSVAIYELYANALRYGSAWGEVKLELFKGVRGVRLTITNHAEPEQIERLQQHVGRIQADASAAYGAEMNAFEGGGRSPMLGLVRVAHESGLHLSLNVVGERVEISAEDTGERD